MRIAVTYENEMIFEHFGHSEHLKLYDVDGGSITAQTMVEAAGSGHGALVNLLKQLNVDVLICGGIGTGAVNALSAARIRLCAGVKGSCDAAVKAYLDGTLSCVSGAKCEHSHEGHSCEDHVNGGEPLHGCCGHHGKGDEDAHGCCGHHAEDAHK